MSLRDDASPLSVNGSPTATTVTAAAFAASTAAPKPLVSVQLVSQPWAVVTVGVRDGGLDAVEHGDDLALGDVVADRLVGPELVCRVVGERPDDRDRRRARAQRQRLVVVLEQDHRLVRARPCRRQIGRRQLCVVHAAGVGDRVVEHAGQVLQRQHAPDVVVDLRDRDLVLAQKRRAVVQVRRVLTRDLDCHLDVDASEQREPRGVGLVCRVAEVDQLLHGLVVTDHGSAESPFLAQDRLQQLEGWRSPGTPLNELNALITVAAPASMAAL